MRKSNLGRTLGTALVIGMLAVSLSACQKPEGPAERAGKEVDKAADTVGQQKRPATRFRTRPRATENNSARPYAWRPGPACPAFFDQVRDAVAARPRGILLE